MKSTVDDDERFLRLLGDRVRELRAQRGVPRRTLATEAGLSERYIAQVEGGRGNISVLLMRRLARALGVPLERLLAVADAPVDRHGRIALIGLRGAGKTTLGTAIAKRLDRPFVELDREVERETGVPLATIFEMYGQEGYRRLERAALERVLAEHEEVVLATGGGIVADAATYDILLTRCVTVWLQASPREHMERVLAQGDLRPMAGNDDAMDDLRRILTERDALYRRADITLATGGHTVAASTKALLAALAPCAE
jgi:XRE family aerobic/anaerobic benzoate catabolism transcriptional regulator